MMSLLIPFRSPRELPGTLLGTILGAFLCFVRYSLEVLVRACFLTRFEAEFSLFFEGFGRLFWHYFGSSRELQRKRRNPWIWWLFHEIQCFLNVDHDHFSKKVRRKEHSKGSPSASLALQWFYVILALFWTPFGLHFGSIFAYFPILFRCLFVYAF